MNVSIKGEGCSPTNKKRRSIDKSSDFANMDKSTKEEKDMSNSKSKSASPSKKKAKADNIQLERKPLTQKPSKKKLTWRKDLVETVDVHSFKKYNIQNTHDDPPFLKEKVKCGCSVF